jgi:hypothetical protein
VLAKYENTGKSCTSLLSDFLVIIRIYVFLGVAKNVFLGKEIIQFI